MSYNQRMTVDDFKYHFTAREIEYDLRFIINGARGDEFDRLNKDIDKANEILANKNKPGETGYKLSRAYGKRHTLDDVKKHMKDFIKVVIKLGRKFGSKFMDGPLDIIKRVDIDGLTQDKSYNENTISRAIVNVMSELVNRDNILKAWEDPTPFIDEPKNSDGSFFSSVKKLFSSKSGGVLGSSGTLGGSDSSPRTSVKMINVIMFIMLIVLVILVIFMMVPTDVLPSFIVKLSPITTKK